MPITPSMTVVTLIISFPLPSGSVHRKVEKDVHTLVRQAVIPRIMDGVMLTSAKFPPITVIIPPPVTGLFGATNFSGTGAS